MNGEREEAILPDKLHTKQKQIDCLDYLVYTMQKEKMT